MNKFKTMAEENKIEVDIENEIIETMKREKRAWEDEIVFVTDKIAFRMRNLIKTCRKNYWGIFDDPYDPVTGREMVWPPLTQWLTESVIKNCDVDSKDFNFRAKVLRALGLVPLVRNVVRNWMDENFFGEDLDEAGRQMAIDGTEIWKTWEEDGEMRRESVDRLNFYIDPNAKSIQDTPAVIERAVISIADFNSMDSWWKKDEVKVRKGLHPTDENLQAEMISETEGIEVWERWGLMPKSWLTGKKSDAKKRIEGHIVVSNLVYSPIVHFVEENLKKDSTGKIVKPYEEGRLRRVRGRWDGVGVPEMVMGLQIWLNVVVNIRISRGRISQLGIFKIKRGANITPQMVKKLAANGAILVDNMEDIQQVVIDEASEASYKDEEVITNWAQRVTQAYEAVTGEPLPSTMPATTAAIQTKFAQSAFVLIREGMGMFIQRWLKRHAWPILQKNLTKGKIALITGSFEEMRQLDAKFVYYLAAKKLDEMNKSKQIVDPLQVNREILGAMEKLMKIGNDRFVNILKKVNLLDFDVQFYMTNEEADKSVIAKDLISLGQMAPQYADIIVKMVMDLMGFDVNQFEELKKSLITTSQVKAPQQMKGASTLNPAGGGQVAGGQTAMKILEEANT
jgi:hypothetical protein